MADEENKDQKQAEDNSTESNDSPGKKGLIISWILTFMVAGLFAVGGYGLSGIFAKAPESVNSEETAIADSDVPPELADKIVKDTAGLPSWTHELEEPVIASLDEPGVTRMIRVTVILEIAPDLDQITGKEFLMEKTVYMRDWLQTYLCGLNLDQVRGSTNQARIKVDIKENFNEILFPDSKGLVNRVMLRDFAIH